MKIARSVLCVIFFIIFAVIITYKLIDTNIFDKALRSSRNSVEKLESLPAYIVTTLISAEDALFFEHKGLDYSSIKKAFTNWLLYGESLRGASTITQQTVKNLYFKNYNKYIRKMPEAFIAIKIEQNYNKMDIISIYLDLAEFGTDVYGFDSAARYYFNKKIEELNSSEVLFLFALLPSPSILQNNCENSARILKARIDKIAYSTARLSFFYDTNKATKVKDFLGLIKQIPVSSLSKDIEISDLKKIYNDLRREFLVFHRQLTDRAINIPCMNDFLSILANIKVENLN